ncbi:MAG: HAD family phosphatase [Bacteroidetes bacterium]|nr:HAD family phosphatase [Bacteroidota bacterium]
MINTVIFDLGGVLIDWSPHHVFDPIFGDDDERRKYFFDNVCTHDWNEQQDAGYPIAKATEERVALFPDWEQEIRAYYGQWEKMLGGPIHGSVDILRELRDRGEHKLLALTNWSAETFPVAEERYDFLQWFEGIAVSGREKTRKPFPDFFRILFDRFGADPQSSVFIDDNLRNVEAGRELGMKGIRFESADQLRADLGRLGVV